VLGPGLWRCTSIVVERSGGPGLRDPRLGPAAIVSEHVCGTEYQEYELSAPQGLQCQCGTFSIGRCVSCQVLVCGIHSAMSDNRRVCGNCLQEERIQRKAESDRRLLALREAHKSDRDEWVGRVRAILAGEPLEARVCHVMRLATHASALTGQQPGVSDLRLFELLPEMFPARKFEAESPPWSDDLIAAWFASASKEPPSRLAAPPRRSLFGGWKDAWVEGWRFSLGSTRLHQAGVSSDGRRLYGRRYFTFEPEAVNATSSLTGADRFHGLALAQMATLAGLPDLPREPEPPPPLAP
jgi:hypothetical protein